MNNAPQNKQLPKELFINKVRRWTDNASANEFPDWQEQIRLLSEMGDLITPELSLEEVITTIYASVNELMDAYQFAVGLYDESEGVILFKGMIENSKQFPDVVIDAFQEDRFTPWCIHNGAEIFINDMDSEYRKYVRKIPNPMAGSPPKAALYVPLRMNGKVVGVITVRTPNKNVYHQHHLYILKTLGNFVIKSLALAAEKAKPAVKSEAQQKNWRWYDEKHLSFKSKKLLSLLTEREKDVLLLLISGLSNKAIAEKLFVSDATIKTHTLNLYRKMNVSNRTSAIMKAIELNWFV
jgi:DNA-binding CsgD family transcriptional regulator